jgi:dipeptidyl aminopeptidase
VTASGNTSLFHGVPDWVYEEEVFQNDFAFWWSPDSNKLAFLSLDETLVPEFSFPIYNPTEDSDAVIPYTTDTIARYPKPGYPNPLVSVHVFDLGLYLEDSATSTMGDLPIEHATLTLDWEDRKPADDGIISEVAWVGNATLLVKEVNRNADSGSVIIFDLDATDTDSRTFGRVVRILGRAGEEGDDGWIENVSLSGLRRRS